MSLVSCDYCCACYFLSYDPRSYCLNDKNLTPSTQETKTVGQEARIIPKIYAALEDHWVGHNSAMVEVEGEIAKQAISILIDPRSTHNYITPRLVEIGTLKKSKHRRSWLVQLAIGIKNKFSEVVTKCPLVMDGLVT